MIRYDRPYLDSGVFISWVWGPDIGRLADGSQGDRNPISEHVLLDAENGKYPLITSYFTMAEVFKKKGDFKTHLTPEQNGKIMKYFENPWITWVAVERFVGELANQLLVKHYDDGLKPCDAVHLACALRGKCDVLLTWDVKFASIKHPGIEIRFPEMPEPDRDLLGDR